MELHSNEVIAVENKRKVCLVWEDLTVVASNGSSSAEKELLKGLNGYAEPNRIMALIGPSGSGKSTLLAALAVLCYSRRLFSGNSNSEGNPHICSSFETSFIYNQK
ncbi:hypothetical protein V8G54_021941 [Vigna mungo]|uniref:ABC transporter domain-containing protein n=1 Tax=Vigna mungo TaxID=3915 RepID=A0AAQ3NE47_VIGMU